MTAIQRTKYGRKEIDKDTKYSEPFIWFVRILFVVIVGNGFRTFTNNFDLGNIIVDIKLAHVTFFVYFVVGYFFVISDFIFYQIQIQRYPYDKHNIARFFEDIVIFLMLYLLLDIASTWPTPKKFWFFLLLMSLWHLIVWGWQLHVNHQYQRDWASGIGHLYKSLLYLALLGFYTLQKGEFQMT